MKNKFVKEEKRLTYKPLLDMISTADNLYLQSKFDDAVSLYREVLTKINKECRYDICECYRKIGNCYYSNKNYDEAIIAYQKTLEYSTTNSSVYAILAYMYYYYDVDLAIEYYSKALLLNPTNKSAISSKSLAMLKSQNYTQKNLKDILEADMRKAKPVLMRGEKPFTHNNKDLKKKSKLNIGYLSSDFYTHAMMQFIFPLLEGHDCKRFNFTLYSTSEKKDSLTEKIKKLKMNWVDCNGMSNKQLAQKIYDDKIDILVDLGGFTHNSCFALFYKPAPIQMQYLGFVNTMGMSDIDYIFADKYTIPEETAKYYTEKPLYLDTYMQRFLFDINDSKWPALNEAPFKKNGYVTFGSFNCPSKINDLTIRLWAKVLENVHNSKLLIFRTQMTDKIIDKFRSKFISLGISSDRIIFDNTKFNGPHFYKYQDVDVALDTFPFNGLTITLELIAMGVPVLTLVGESMQSRGAARINKALNLDELVAQTEKEYVQAAKELVDNTEKIEFYRKNLRKILSESILTNDYAGFANCVENAYQKAWDTYLASI